MNRLSIHLSTASLTFCLGVLTAALYPPTEHYQPPAVILPAPVIIEQNDQQNASHKPLTFYGVRCPNKTCNMDTRVCYESSDGVLVTVIAETYKSPDEAKGWLQLSLKNANERADEIIERAPKLNAGGRRVGERVVIRHTPASPTGESSHSVEWTHGPNFDVVYSLSLNHALELERAFLSGEVKLHSYFDYDLPPPNNGMQRTRN